MANVVTFNFLAPVSNSDEITITYTSNGGTQTITAEFGTDIGISEDLSEQAAYVYGFFVNYYPNLASSYSGTTATLYLNLEGAQITSVTAPEEIEVTTSDLVTTVSGLSNDRYYANNPVYLTIQSTEYASYYVVSVVNTFTQVSSGNIIVYPSTDGKAIINVSPIIKTILQLPVDAPAYNMSLFRFTIATPGAGEVYISKTFVRGGIRGDYVNLFAPANSYARPVDLLPVWRGWETADYRFIGQGLFKIPLADIPEANIEYQDFIPCNPVYFKFLNSRGGYSNWMFESLQESDVNNHLGTTAFGTTINDLGSESEVNLKVTGKIPAKYVELIRDLIISPEIYYKRSVTDSYKRIYAGRNTLPTDVNKRGYKVSLNFENINRFNPSLLWSN